MSKHLTHFASLITYEYRTADLCDGALVELHDVAGERARLVAEDVLHHSELLVQVGGPRHRRRVRLFVVHLTVHGDEFCL